ncbi:hypothetical protein [Achromobacter kerstersii]
MMNQPAHSRHAEPPTAIVINETVFCDTETSPDVLDLYFSRLLVSMESVRSQRLTPNCRLAHVLYVSSDKKEYIQRLKAIAEDKNTEQKKLLVVVYTHPSEGYPFPPGSHIDLVKMPNRTSDYRDALFQKALAELSSAITWDASAYFIRIALDDDDFWAPWHLDEVIAAAEHFLNDKTKDTFAIGLTNGFIANVDESRAVLTTIKFNRCLNGNKFVVSRSLEKMRDLSPWGINDWVDVGVQRAFRSQHNGDLVLIENGVPSFCYFRRGYNLSQQNKDWCIEEKLNQTSFRSEHELIEALYAHSAQHNVRHVKEIFNEETLKVTVRYLKDHLKFNSSFDSLKQPGDLIAFYLLKDGDRVAALMYSGTRSSGEFALGYGPGTYRIKAFFKRNGVVEKTAVSVALTHID